MFFRPLKVAFHRSFIGKVAILLVSLMISCNLSAEPLTIVVEQSPPYIEQSRQDKGIISALVIASFARSGVKVNLEYADWYQAEQAVDKHHHLSFMWEKTKPLMKKWLFSEPIYLQRHKLAFLTDKKPLSVQYLHQLRGIKIGLTQGFSYGSEFDKFKSKLNVLESNSEYKNVENLLKQKVSAIVIDAAVATDLVHKYFKQYEQKHITFVDAPYFNQTVYYLVCSKQYGNCLNYIKKFNQGLAQLNKDGTGQQILSKIVQSN